MAVLVVAAGLLGPSALQAGPWVIGKYNTQAKLTFFSHSTDREFILTPRLVGSGTAPAGEKLPYLFNGESISRAYLLELRYGVLRFLDLRALFSYYDLQYNDDGGDRHNSNFGDIYGEAIVQLLRDPIALAVRAGVKAPTAEFEIDPQRVPLSENQWDIEGALSAGRSFYPVPMYAKGEVGYRYRFENTETKIKPGNVVFFMAETGGFPFKQFLVKLMFDGFLGEGRESREFGFLVKNPEGRELFAISPFVTFFAPRGFFVEGGVRFLLAGRDYPAGQQYLLALGWRRF